MKKSHFIKCWFNDGNKRVYDTYDFLPPPLVCSKEILNTWGGFQIEHQGITETDDFKYILYLIEVLTDFNKDAYDYVMNWLADIIQNPGKKCGIAVIFKSKPGAGKGTLIEILRRIMGSYISETSNPQNDLFGNHGNIHIGKLLCSLDEVKSSDTSKCLGRLKNVITSDHCVYNEKGQKQVEVKNSCRFIFTTNESFPLSIDKEDRRYFATNCSNILCKDNTFWKDFYKKLENKKSIKGFFDHLMNRDISSVNWMAFPITELRSEIIECSLHPIIYFMDEFIRSDLFQRQGTQKISATELYSHYTAYCVDKRINVYSSNSRSFGIIFKDNIDLNGCNIEKKKSHGIMVYVIDKNSVFEWLSENNYSTYDALPTFEFEEDEDEL